MQTKDDFYNQLDSLLGLVPKNEHIILLGDFSARVGADYSA